MLSATDPRLVRRALSRLREKGTRVAAADPVRAAQPGLYAIHASATTWRDLGLGKPPDSRPLYVGKAETSLGLRDLKGHFGIAERKKQSPTGSSTVRRSLAALLAAADGYAGHPRNPDNPSHFANYGLSKADDERLSAWMARRLTISFWPHRDAPALDGLETAVLRVLTPPLNLDKIVTPWRGDVRAARKVLADQARGFKLKGVSG
jgi:hypothetical protein